MTAANQQFLEYHLHLFVTAELASQVNGSPTFLTVPTESFESLAGLTGRQQIRSLQVGEYLQQYHVRQSVEPARLQSNAFLAQHHHFSGQRTE